VRKSPQPPDIKLLPSGIKRGLLLLPAWTKRLTTSVFDESLLEVRKISELSTEGQTLFDLLCLIVDIKYQHKYGKQFEHQDGKGYSLADTNSEEDLE
jgi:hypothetical protein